MTRDTILNASVPVTLDGRDYVLRYRAWAFITYLEATGRDLMTDVQELGAMVAAGQPQPDPAASPVAGLQFGRIFLMLRDIIWAGLTDAQPEVKRDDVARMLDLREFPVVTEAVMGALRLTLPDQAAAERPTEARSATNGHGSPSAAGTGSGPSSATEAESPQESSYVSLCGTSAA